MANFKSGYDYVIIDFVLNIAGYNKLNYIKVVIY